ncbi:MAG: hypothetical protein GW859_02290 [Sphingomonadales bacterium]|nr:hypothetical protein [Sphingomonadales bacterium]
MTELFSIDCELENGLTLFKRDVVMKSGGQAQIVQIRKDDVVIATFCECGGVRQNCPTPQFPSCDCTKDPPVLTCE